MDPEKEVMPGNNYEIIEIEEVTEALGRSGNGRRTVFIASKISPISKITLFESTPIEWHISNDASKTAALERRLENGYYKVLQRLLGEGWEPIGTAPNGRVRSMRRPIPDVVSSKEVTFELDSDDGWRSINGLWVNLTTFTGIGVESNRAGALTGGLHSAPLTGAF